MATHTVAQGETLASIAKQYGFLSWKTIYDHPDNAAFRSKRPDPGLLHPGDTLVIPDKQEKSVKRAAGASHSFQAKSQRLRLRLAAEDPNRKRFANAPYKLEVGGTVLTGTTNGQGIVDEEIPVGVEEGKLEIGGYAWPLKIGHLNPVEQTPDDGVTGIQARLSNLGYDVGPIDGVVGKRTRAGIRAFQRDNPPLVVDGICGPKTRAKLIEKFGG